MQHAQQPIADVTRSLECRRILRNLSDRAFTPAWIAVRLRVTPATVLAWARGEEVPAPAELAQLRVLVKVARHDA
jgi:hypothetical protein